MAKVENVVNPPQNPTPNSKTQPLVLGLALKLVTTTPNMNDPIKFTIKVPSMELTPGIIQPHNRPTP
jgi:hypothetical protein